MIRLAINHLLLLKAQFYHSYFSLEINFIIVTIVETLSKIQTLKIHFVSKLVKIQRLHLCTHKTLDYICTNFKNLFPCSKVKSLLYLKSKLMNHSISGSGVHLTF